MRDYQVLRLALALLAVPAFAAPSVKVSPTALSFTYQEGSATLPAAQTLAISAAVATAANTPVYVASGGSQWLIFTPQSGKATLSVSVSVNPTSLPIGQYSEVLSITTPLTGGDPVTVLVSLTVKAAPADIKVSPGALTFTYRLGDSAPASQVASLTTTGGLLSFSAAATGAKWMRLAPPTGAVFPGFRTAINVSVDVTDLVPGTQKGALTITSTDAITKTITVPVTLTIQPGQAVVTSVWPPRITVGASDTTFTITGDRFFSGTTVKSGATALKSTLIGTNALNVIVPANLLAAAGQVPLVVANPDPGGGAAAPVNIDVRPPGPLVLAAVNGASQLPSLVAPGAVITIYGSGLGPEPLVAFDGSTTALPTVMGGTQVLLGGVPIPIIYSSSRQVSAVAPNGLTVDQPYALEVEFGGVRSSAIQVGTTSASPAIFTANGSGTGNLAAFQTDPVKGTVALNSEKAPASKGSVVTIYATGIAPIAPIPPDGFIATDASANSIPGITVSLGDVAADVLYAGFAPGLVVGIVQINFRIPDTTPTGKAVPVTVRIGNGSSQAGATLNIK